MSVMTSGDSPSGSLNNPVGDDTKAHVQAAKMKGGKSPQTTGKLAKHVAAASKVGKTGGGRRK